MTNQWQSGIKRKAKEARGCYFQNYRLLLERIPSPYGIRIELRTTRGRDRPACPGSAPGDAALGRGPRSRCIYAGAGRVRRVLLLLLLQPPGPISRNPQTSASSRAVGSVSAAVLRRSRGARGRASSATVLEADGDCPLDGFAGRAAGSTHPFLPRRTVVRSARCPPTPVCRAEACWVSLRSGTVEGSPKAVSP
ncbi:uncharacterized protein LOC105235839 isoform X2 [Ailuropoda melanoleuca]|uniref:uncharacterized protein LOC105235839 isoform X2 n=1 Tax=Ailuropoda melanoleuca TaxID=9646 RepID=UPI0014944497|nr:uncharacterized protein LOC105235839 isoform X2 [Ailuropoda melanoleuca]XP_034496545.1 uncharacterized protein LOC105235839 isoform X2 [Ailuropoda melanoleuca]